MRDKDTLHTNLCPSDHCSNPSHTTFATRSANLNVVVVLDYVSLHLIVFHHVNVLNSFHSISGVVKRHKYTFYFEYVQCVRCKLGIWCITHLQHMPCTFNILWHPSAYEYDFNHSDVCNTRTQKMKKMYSDFHIELSQAPDWPCEQTTSKINRLSLSPLKGVGVHNEIS